MKKEILEEINFMKYISGYKKGRVISEQTQTIGNQCQDKDDCPQNYNCFNGYCSPQTITSSGTYGSCKQTSDCAVGYVCENQQCKIDLKSGYWTQSGAKPSATGSDPIYTGPGGSEFHTGWDEGEGTPPKPSIYNTQKENYFNRLVNKVLFEQDYSTVGNQCDNVADCDANENCVSGYCVPKTIYASGTYGQCKVNSDCANGFKCENQQCKVDLNSTYWKQTGSKPSATGDNPIYTGPGGSEFHTGWNDGEDAPTKPLDKDVQK